MKSVLPSSFIGLGATSLTLGNELFVNGGSTPVYIETIYRDEDYIANLHRELVQFNLELNRMVDEVADKARAQAHRLGA